MTRLHAQPYDISASGFYFETAEVYDTNRKALRNDYGEPVEEFEIQFIDGADIDCTLATAIGLNQGNFRDYLNCVDAWDEAEKTLVVIAVGDRGYPFEGSTAPSDFDIDVYHLDSLRELAEQFVEEGLFGDIPEHLQFYIDYDAIARDLGVDYSEITIAGTHLIYRSG